MLPPEEQQARQEMEIYGEVEAISGTRRRGGGGGGRRKKFLLLAAQRISSGQQAVRRDPRTNSSGFNEDLYI